MKKLLYIDDQNSDAFVRRLGEIFPGTQIVPLWDLDDFRGAIENSRESGVYPEAIMIDVYRHGDQLWGLGAAERILEWYATSAPEKTPQHILFKSGDDDWARDCSNKLTAPEKCRVYAASLLELNIVHAVVENMPPSEAYTQLTGLRQFASHVLGIQIPLNQKEIDQFLLDKDLCEPKDLVRIALNGDIDRRETLSRIREEFYKASEARYTPEADYSFKYGGAALSFKFSAGIASKGPAAFSAADVDRFAKQGQKPILILPQSKPSVIPRLGKLGGMVVLDPAGAGHLSILIQSHGIAGLFGVTNEKEEIQKALESIKPGDMVSLNTRSGDLIHADVTIENQDNHCLYDWIDDVRDLLRKEKRQTPKLAFKGTADYPEQAHDAVESAGVGLARTEHFALHDKGHRTALKKALLLQTPEALEEFRKQQAHSFKTFLDQRRIFDPAFPMRVRLLDMPALEILTTKKERERYAALYGDLSVRGVQQALRQPALYEAQLHALFEAWKNADEKNKIFLEETGWGEEKDGNDRIAMEIMVPMVRRAEELADIGIMTQRVAVEYGRTDSDYRFGSMLETLDACDDITAIAPLCDFISIGSNDLTSEILGCARDDWEHRHELTVNQFRGQDPFLSLTPRHPLMPLLRKAVKEARAANPDIQIDLCGEHATRIESLNALRPLKLAGVSVPPQPRFLKGLALTYDYDTCLQALESVAARRARKAAPSP